MRDQFWLSDEQWAAIKPHLPYYAAGKRREDDRRIITGIIHVLQSGCRWRDCPPGYGPSTTVYNRCIAPGSLDTSLSHAAGLSDIAVCHA